MADHYRSVAVSLGFDPSQVLKRPRNSEIVEDAFGAVSRTFAIWELLSDLAQFSYSMNRHLDAHEPMLDALYES